MRQLLLFLRIVVFFPTVIIIIIDETSSSVDASAVDIKIHVPKVFRWPFGIWLNCSVHHNHQDASDILASTDNHSVKEIRWFKDKELFYTYDKSQKSKSIHFLYGKGVHNVQMDSSEEANVLLDPTDMNTTGCYKCEVIMMNGEKKARDARALGIFLPQDPEPEIKIEHQLLEGSYVDLIIKEMGQILTVNCTSPLSNPPSELSLRINGEEPEINFRHELEEKVSHWIYPDSYSYSSQVFQTRHSVSFKITPEMVKSGFLKIHCVSVTHGPHGLLDQYESEVVRIRVLEVYKKIYAKASIERHKYVFWGLLGSLITIFGLWYTYESYVTSKALKDISDGEKFKDNVSNISSYAYACRRESEVAIQQNATETNNNPDSDPVALNDKKHHDPSNQMSEKMI